MKANYIREIVMKVIFFIAACASVFAVILICVFLFANGIPAMGEIGIFKFFLVQNGGLQMILRNTSNDSRKYLCYGQERL